MLAPYASSKRFVNCMTESVARELVMQGKDVEVLGIRVGEVCGTAYNKNTAALFEPDAKTMARAALARVGCGRTTVIGYWAHALQVAGLHLAPKLIQERSMQNVIRTRWKTDQLMMKSE
ncbi:putative short chain dehydrogenase [Mycena sanguinolenta]|uniref:Putative short chain dehydrogenase n=1 Tax=Mycena sanguinolenta TaxID=230812 RepID=A0A8H6XRE6_9AGAR|nr:putative short chain dehydrogenase [Mycena sanguinolenta]